MNDFFIAALWKDGIFFARFLSEKLSFFENYDLKNSIWMLEKMGLTIFGNPRKTTGSSHKQRRLSLLVLK